MRCNLMKKNKGTHVAQRAVGIVIFACLFAFAFTSCKEEEPTKPLPPEGDLSQVYVDDIWFKYPVVWGDPGTYYAEDSTVYILDGDKLRIEMYNTPLFIPEDFDNIIVQDTIIGDTIKIFVDPSSQMNIRYITTISYGLTIYNIPKNKTFWVKIAQNIIRYSKKFSTW